MLKEQVKMIFWVIPCQHSKRWVAHNCVVNFLILFELNVRGCSYFYKIYFYIGNVKTSVDVDVKYVSTNLESTMILGTRLHSNGHWIEELRYELYLYLNYKGKSLWPNLSPCSQIIRKKFLVLNSKVEVKKY